MRSGMFRSHPIEANAMHFPRTWMNLGALGSFLLVLAVSGCGEGSNNPAFTPAPTAPIATLKSGPTLLPELEVCLGGATALAVQLDRKPPKAVDIQIRTLDFDGAFDVPTSVTVPANEAIKIFLVRAKIGDFVGAKAELSIVPGERYQVGTPASFTLTVADTDLPTITIVGSEDALLSTGATEPYFLQRSDVPPTAISVPLVVEGDTAAFGVTPAEVTIAAGQSDGSFEVRAIGSEGAAEISFLPPLGYCLGDTPSVAVTIE